MPFQPNTNHNYFWWVNCGQHHCKCRKNHIAKSGSKMYTVIKYGDIHPQENTQYYYILMHVMPTPQLKPCQLKSGKEIPPIGRDQCLKIKQYAKYGAKTSVPSSPNISVYFQLTCCQIGCPEEHATQLNIHKMWHGRLILQINQVYVHNTNMQTWPVVKDKYRWGCESGPRTPGPEKTTRSRVSNYPKATPVSASPLRNDRTAGTAGTV